MLQEAKYKVGNQLVAVVSTYPGKAQIDLTHEAIKRFSRSTGYCNVKSSKYRIVSWGAVTVEDLIVIADWCDEKGFSGMAIGLREGLEKYGGWYWRTGGRNI